MIVREWMCSLPLLGLAALQVCSGFCPKETTQLTVAQKYARLDTALNGGLFGDAGDALKGLFGGDDQSRGGPKTVFDIPVENIKPGPLRFFLQIYIVGEKNTQGETQTWLPREAKDGGLEIYFKDGTGMCKISLEPNNIKAERYGQKPSLQYLLQESVMLHGVLDELNTVAFEADVEESKRLLLVEERFLAKARETLPARQD